MANYTLQDLIEEYVFQRQHNVRPELAMNLLKELRPNLTPKELQMLNQEIRAWEAEQAKSARPTPPPAPATITQPVPPLMPPPGLPSLTRVGAQTEMMSCPHCGTANPTHSKYCYSCGQLLSVVDLSQTDRLYEEVEDPATFGNLSSLVITVRGHEGRPIVLDVAYQALVIGRGDHSSPRSPDIDLASYGGKENGVSRLHATLQRADKSLTLTDRGSVNFTFINGEKIHPNEVRVIRDGDEVRFGRLTTRFTFRRELRRLGGLSPEGS